MQTLVQRFIACLVAPLALFGATPSPAPGVPPPAGDRVYALAGSWACRSAEGVIVRSAGVRNGDTVKVHDDVDEAGKRSSFDDRYTFDPAQQRWHVVSGLGGFSGEAPAWSGNGWTVQGDDVNHVARRMTLDLLPNGDFRRTLFYQNGAGAFVLDTIERCSPGATPPSTGTCIAERYPAATLETTPANGRFIPPNLRHGVVQIVVSLNERSEIVGTRVQSSPDPALNGPALAAARAAKFRTMIMNCKPVGADYIFSVNFDE
jgi:hypothetical protein